MVIDKLYEITQRASKSRHQNLRSPRSHADEATSDTRLADPINQPEPKLKVPEILKMTSVSALFAELERKHSSALKN